MERMTKEELKKELERLKDFKVYVFEGEVYVKAEDYKEIAIENKKLKERVSELEDVSEDYDLLSKDFITLGEENEKLKKYYDRDKEELMESCYSLAKENEKLKEENEGLKKYICEGLCN